MANLDRWKPRDLYLALVCSQLWNPYLIKDTTTLERVQRCATKYILNNYCKLHLLNLKLLYHWCILLIFFVKSLKQPSNHFSILLFLSTGQDQLQIINYYISHSSNNKIRNSYFNRLPRLWNAVYSSLLSTQICTSIQSRH